jgi:hypothetical protein
MQARDVLVTTPGGSFVLSNAFTVKQALPAITSVEPNNGSQGATLNVIITGENVNGTSVVRLGEGIAINSSHNQPEYVEAELPLYRYCNRRQEVSVTTPGGSFSLTESFTVKQGYRLYIVSTAEAARERP